MSSFIEDHLIESLAIQLMEHELGWAPVSVYEAPSFLPWFPLPNPE
jgi:hypothetical protein